MNGYSGFLPDSYFDLRDAIGNAFPDKATIQRLRKLRVSYVIVFRRVFPDVPEKDRLSELGVELVMSTSSGVDIFEIKNAPDNAGP